MERTTDEIMYHTRGHGINDGILPVIIAFSGVILIGLAAFYTTSHSHSIISQEDHQQRVLACLEGYASQHSKDSINKIMTECYNQVQQEEREYRRMEDFTAMSTQQLVELSKKQQDKTGADNQAIRLELKARVQSQNDQTAKGFLQTGK